MPRRTTNKKVIDAKIKIYQCIRRDFNRYMDDGRTYAYAINKLIEKYGYAENTLYQIIKKLGYYSNT